MTRPPGSSLKLSPHAPERARRRRRAVLLVSAGVLGVLALLVAALWALLGWLGQVFGYQSNDANLPLTLLLALLLLSGLVLLGRTRLREWLRRR